MTTLNTPLETPPKRPKGKKGGLQYDQEIFRGKIRRRFYPSEEQLWKDMDFVNRHAPEYDQTEGQRDCRKWKKDNFREYMNKYADLEKLRLLSLIPEQGASGTTSDMGADKAKALIDSLLRNDDAKPE